MLVKFFTVLQRDLVMQLLVKQYGTRNSPGPQDFSLAQEWHLFLVVLFTLLEYDIDKLQIIQQNNNDHKTERPIAVSKKQKTNYSGTNEDWLYVLNSSEHKDTNSYIEDVLHIKKPCNHKNTFRPKLSSLLNVGKISNQVILSPYLPVSILSYLIFSTRNSSSTPFHNVLALLFSRISKVLQQR